MPGGRREGAGRKPGTANKRTREIANEAAANGITPLEVLITSMRLAWQKSEEEEHAGEHLHTAVSWAEKAAPYIHARIAAVTHSGSVDGKLTGKLIVTWGDGSK